MDSIVSLMGNFHTLYIMGLCGKTKVQNIRGLNAAPLSAPFMLGAATGKAPGTAWKRWSYCAATASAHYFAVSVDESP